MSTYNAILFTKQDLLLKSIKFQVQSQNSIYFSNCKKVQKNTLNIFVNKKSGYRFHRFFLINRKIFNYIGTGKIRICAYLKI